MVSFIYFLFKYLFTYLISISILHRLFYSVFDKAFPCQIFDSKAGYIIIMYIIEEIIINRIMNHNVSWKPYENE